MLHLELTQEEQMILAEILEAEVTELRAEVHHTDNLDYKHMLEAREVIVKKLLAVVQQSRPEVQRV